MNKFKDKVAQISLEVGGSHYPAVNIHLQEQMVRMVVEECLDAVNNCKHKKVYTTYDLDQFNYTIEQAGQAIKERFGL